MKTRITKFMATGLLALSGFALIAPSANAQNANNNTGDLLLGFQNPGGTQGSDQVILVSLGSAGVLRDATGNVNNIINIGTLLANTFGSNWYELTTLYVGAFSASNSSTTATTLVNGDPSRTVYISAARTAVGTEGTAQSVGWSGIGAGSLGTASTQMLGDANSLETLGTTASLALSTGVSNYDDHNPFNLGNQSTAYSTFAGGAQSQFGTGLFGTLGGVSAEAGLDLYRLQARNNITDQYGFGAANGTSEYQGTLVIDQSGNVSLIQAAAVPEPSTNALIGMAAIGGLYFMRQKRKQVLLS